MWDTSNNSDYCYHLTGSAGELTGSAGEFLCTLCKLSGSHSYVAGHFESPSNRLPTNKT